MASCALSGQGALMEIPQVLFVFPSEKQLPPPSLSPLFSSSKISSLVEPPTPHVYHKLNLGFMNKAKK